MWEMMKAAFAGGAITFGTYFTFMLLMRGCVAVVDAHEPSEVLGKEGVQGVGVYEVYGSRGKAIIDPRIYDHLYSSVQPQVIVVEQEVRDTLTAGDASGYVACNREQRFYAYVIKRFEERTDMPPGYWDETIGMYKDLIKGCDL